MLQNGLSLHPVWLEPGVNGVRPYDRRKASMLFYQLVPSPEERDWAQSLDKVLSQLVGLREPVALEILGAGDFFHCQFVVQRRDAVLLRAAISSAFQYSHVIEQTPDPLCKGYMAIKASRAKREYHFLDYLSKPPIYLSVFNAGAAGRTDLVLHLHSIFEQLQDTELGFYQLLFLPCRQNWAETNRQTLSLDLLLAPEQAFLKTQARQRTSGFSGFSTALRIGGFIDRAKVRSFMGRMHGVVRGLALGDHRLEYLTRRDYFDAGILRRDHFYLLFNRVAFRPGMVLSQEELAAIFPVFLPSSLERVPGLTQARRSYPAPASPSGSGQVLGLNVHQGQQREVRVGSHLPNEHIYIVGKSGWGKTTLMERLIAQHIKAGDGFGVIDPHGDLIRRVLPMIPEGRIPQTLYFNPADPKYVIPFNVLAHGGSQLEKEHLRADLLDFFEELIGEKLGVNIEHVLGHSLVTLLSRPDSTLADIKRLLVDGHFRAGVISDIEEPELIEFWKHEFPAWSRSGALMTITNKLSPLLLPGSLLAPLLSSRANRLDFSSMMENRGIFLCNIAQGALTRRNSKLLGRLVLSRIAITAMMRDLSRPMVPWYLYVDEVQEVAGRSLEEILRGGRKFGLHLRMNNQARKDLPESLRVAVTSVATLVSFCIDDVAEQAETEKLLGRKFSAAEIGSLPKGQPVVKMDGHVFNLVVPQGQDPRTELVEQVIEHSRHKYAVQRPAEEHKGPDVREQEGGTTMSATRPTNRAKKTSIIDEPIEEMYDEL